MKGDRSFETIETFVSGCFVDNEIKVDRDKDQRQQKTDTKTSETRPLSEDVGE
jgi:hypothetical protein